MTLAVPLMSSLPSSTLLTSVVHSTSAANTPSCCPCCTSCCCCPPAGCSVPAGAVLLLPRLLGRGVTLLTVTTASTSTSNNNGLINPTSCLTYTAPGNVPPNAAENSDAVNMPGTSGAPKADCWAAVVWACSGLVSPVSVAKVWASVAVKVRRRVRRSPIARWTTAPGSCYSWGEGEGVGWDGEVSVAYVCVCVCVRLVDVVWCGWCWCGVVGYGLTLVRMAKRRVDCCGTHRRTSRCHRGRSARLCSSIAACR